MPDYIIQQHRSNWILDESRNNTFVSGNKYRKVKTIVDSAGRINGILTFGSKFSSHLLAAAYWAMRLKVPMTGIIISNHNIQLHDYPNLRMASLLHANLVVVSEKDAYTAIESEKYRLSNYLWIPGGAHTIEGANAYTSLFIHLYQDHPQLRRLNAIVLPLGTGTTALGVLNAISSLGLETSVIGVTVSRSKDQCINAIRDIAPRFNESQLIINEAFAGKYEIRNTTTEAARQRFFDETGILIDPIYNAKAATVFYDLCLENCMLINTGGMLNNLL